MSAASNLSTASTTASAQEACYWLAKHNVPCHVLIAGGGLVDRTLIAAQLARYDAIVVCEPAHFSGEQKVAVDAADKQAKLVRWAGKNKTIDAEKLRQLMPGQITIAGAERIMAVPRVRADGAAIVHLLNRNYDKNSDGVETQTNVTLVQNHPLRWDDPSGDGKLAPIVSTPLPALRA